MTIHKTALAFLSVLGLAMSHVVVASDATDREWTHRQTGKSVRATLLEVDLHRGVARFLDAHDRELHARLADLSDQDLTFIRSSQTLDVQQRFVTVLQSEDVTISGTVKDRNGNPAKNVSVRAVRQDEPDIVLDRDITDPDDGSYRLKIATNVDLRQVRLDFVPLLPGLVPGTDEQLKSDEGQTINKVLDGVPASSGGAAPAAVEAMGDSADGVPPREMRIQVAPMQRAELRPMLSEDRAQDELKQIFDNLLTMEEFLQRTELKDQVDDDDIQLRNRILEYLEAVKTLPQIRPGSGRIYNSVANKIRYLREEYGLTAFDQVSPCPVPGVSSAQVVCPTIRVCHPVCRPVCPPRTRPLFRRFLCQ
ncbi:hypothetical protein Enr13x_18480 [Stieleria neptunia]|uniref:Carboxypeptidase regulatory-like domain-containing protein n=1 Tax=Stieleria neptunia TaxID=2527979 RepID=A0A518HMC7_9BACT|nr:carboxypeptidase-like regulatory domain-containing protein [Stieleria neptunia]QDV42005.1 hypothetical protein Enr13x_18480 [Stieleria neptunia]